jgi:uncharacterized protein YheU (UPF0270 family)
MKLLEEVIFILPDNLITDEIDKMIDNLVERIGINMGRIEISINIKLNKLSREAEQVNRLEFEKSDELMKLIQSKFNETLPSWMEKSTNKMKT